MFAWDPGQYARFAGDRSRPFFDLLARVGAESPERVLELGCGDGTLTQTLAARWPGATVVGVDSSPDMLRRAATHRSDRLEFRCTDVAALEPDADVDVMISNALWQWIPEHPALLLRWARAMRATSWIAFQVPGNFESPSHVLMRELAGSARWAARLDGVLRHGDAVLEPDGYARLLMAEGWSVDAWETTYLHVLAGPDPVLDWIRGTGLRPVLAALEPGEGDEFCAELAILLRRAYLPSDVGTVFPFRRIFCVARRPAPQTQEMAPR